jgi:hypothetical protein
MTHRRLLVLSCLGFAIAVGCGGGTADPGDPPASQKPPWYDQAPPRLAENEIGQQAPSSADQTADFNDQAPSFNDQSPSGVGTSPTASASCDDLCRRSVDSGCTTDPANCLGECEEARAETAALGCGRVFDMLLGCFVQAPVTGCDDDIIETGACSNELILYLGCVEPDALLEGNCTLSGGCVNCANACAECLCDTNNDVEICAVDCAQTAQ